MDSEGHAVRALHTYKDGKSALARDKKMGAATVFPQEILANGYSGVFSSV
jgi:hypothetical protein